jgi:hypothetical protein
LKKEGGGRGEIRRVSCWAGLIFCETKNALKRKTTNQKTNEKKPKRLREWSAQRRASERANDAKTKKKEKKGVCF